MTEEQLEQGSIIHNHLKEYAQSVKDLSEEVQRLTEYPDRNWNFTYNTWQNEEIKKLYEEEFLQFVKQLEHKLIQRRAALEKAFAEI